MSRPNRNRKLTDETIINIFEDLASGMLQSEVAEKYDLRQAEVSGIKRRTNYKYVDVPLELIEAAKETPHRGERHHNSILSDAEVRLVFALRASGLTCSQIAKQYGVTKSCIDCILSRRRANIPQAILDSLPGKRNLTDDEVVQIFELHAQGKTANEIAKEVGRSAGTVTEVVQRKIYGDVEIPEETLKKSALPLRFRRKLASINLYIAGRDSS